MNVNGAGPSSEPSEASGGGRAHGGARDTHTEWRGTFGRSFGLYEEVNLKSSQ